MGPRQLFDYFLMIFYSQRLTLKLLLFSARQALSTFGGQFVRGQLSRVHDNWPQQTDSERTDRRTNWPPKVLRALVALKTISRQIALNDGWFTGFRLFENVNKYIVRES